MKTKLVFFIASLTMITGGAECYSNSDGFQKNNYSTSTWGAENRFSVQNMSKKNLNFWAAFKLTGGMYSYFHQTMTERPAPFDQGFILKFLHGRYLALDEVAWKNVDKDLKQDLATKTTAYKPKISFFRMLEAWFYQHWTTFKAVFTGKDTSDHLFFNHNFSPYDFYLNARMSGCDLRFPFRYDLVGENKYAWRIGKGWHISPAVSEIDSLNNYFYDEQLLEPFQEGKYAIKSPKIRIFMIPNQSRLVVKNIPYLLNGIQNKFNLSTKQMKQIQIAPETYHEEIWNTPNFDFKINFLNPKDLNQIYFSLFVRFYWTQKA